jgi:hypothetical protein
MTHRGIRAGPVISRNSSHMLAMNTSPRLLRWTFLLVCGAAVLPLLAAEPVPLRCSFTAGTTNGYRVTLESPSETSPRKYEGTLVYTVKSVDENAAVLQMRGQFVPKRETGPMIYMPEGPWGGGWRFGPMPPFAEARVDSQGRVVRTQGIPEIPKLLESYASVLFEPFPKDAAAEWRSETEMTAEEDASARTPGGPYYGGYYGGFPGSGLPRLAGTRTVNCRILEAGPETVRLGKQVEFRSWLRTGDQPRLVVSGKSELVFDRGTGLLRTLKFEGSSITTTPDLTQRTPLVLRIEPLPTEELAMALPVPGAKPPVLGEAEFKKLLEDLHSGDSGAQIQAASRLMSSDFASRANELLPVVLPFASGSDPILRQLAAAVLAKAATTEHVPLLLKLLRGEDFGQQQSVLEALRRLKDKRAIEPLTELVARGAGSAQMAAETLASFGPVVEAAALRLLNEKHIETRRRGCEILQKVGTNQSLEMLKGLVGEDDNMLNQSATEAIRAIRAREGSGAGQ